MLDAISQESNLTTTENGAITYRSTHSCCLDLFACIGAIRRRDERDIETLFLRAYAEDSLLAMKMLFYARDVRGGLGERKVPRILFHWLAVHEPEALQKNIPLIPFYGRFDDLLTLLDTPLESAAVDFLKKTLEQDVKDAAAGRPVSLLAKWLPSINTASEEAVQTAKKLAKKFGMTAKEYRKTLASLRKNINILENHLREKDYTFDYEKQPGRALFKYREAFQRNDEARYQDFLDRVTEGKATMHAGTLYPYDIVRPICKADMIEENPTISKEQRKVLDTTWKSLPDFTHGENALAIVDGSGSMYWNYPGCSARPIEVAESLGIYFAERNTGIFKDHFITFSDHPTLVSIKGSDITEKVRYSMTYNDYTNTDFQKVFDLILDAALRHHVPQEELPAKLYVISDMEFDDCSIYDEEKKEWISHETNFECAKKKFEEAGYRLPQVIFWNVAARHAQVPVLADVPNVTLVSGMSPRLFDFITGPDCSPYQFMMEVLGSERYKAVGV